MGTAKRQRHKQRHAARVRAAEEARRRHDRRRKTIAVVALLGIMGILFASLALVGNNGNGNDDSDERDNEGTTDQLAETDQPTEPQASIEPGASIDGPTPCPPEDGSAERTTSFSEAPPMCIDPEATYQAVMTTDAGEIVIDLDASAAPETVNNFVTLARYGYYEGVLFHRIVPGFVIQGGDPLGDPPGTGGPGYTIDEEPPTEPNEDGTLYAKYDLAMAKTAAPSSTGSQFFIVTGDSTGALDSAGTYSLFGSVEASSYGVVDAIASTPVAGDAPTVDVRIQSVEIRES